jgi:hypothetical protein
MKFFSTNISSADSSKLRKHSLNNNLATKCLVILCFLSLMTVDMAVSAEENVKKYPLPMDWHAPVDTVLKSFFDIIEPWKVQSSTYERGVPHVHD